MLKKFICLIVSAFLCLCSHAMNKNIPPVEVGGVTRAGHPEFFTSFANPDAIYFRPDDPGVFFCTEQPIVDRVPLIGHYQNPDTKKKGQTHGDTYNVRTRIALIEFDKNALERVAPQSVRTILAQNGFADLSKVEFYANIISNFVHTEQTPFGAATNSCNVAFHPIIRRWRGSGFANFNIAVNAGIFEPNGVSAHSGGIAFDNLGSLDTHYHDREAFSPDNGRFNIDPQRGIVTFWVVGVHSGHANVTFTIMANNEVTEQLLLRLTNQPNFESLLRMLQNTTSALNQPDATVLENATRILRQASGVSAAIAPAPSFVGIGRKLGTAEPHRFESISNLLSQRGISGRSMAEAYMAATTSGRYPLAPQHITAAPGPSHATSSTKRTLTKEDQENLKDMTMAFQKLALSGSHEDLDSALSLLTSIRGLDPAQAELCELMLRVD